MTDLPRTEQDSVLKDPSLLAILLGNLVSIVMALSFGWDMGQLLWVYWGQSVAIGVMNFWRMWTLKEFSTKNLKMNDEPVPETDAGKKQVATFFAFHYGFFHFGYAAFLWQEAPLAEFSQTDIVLIIAAFSAFAGSHRFSLLYNTGRDFKHKKPNIGTLMFYPYLRIIPMHLVIVFFGSLSEFETSAKMLLLFLGLKTLADVSMHIVEHRIFQKHPKEKLIIKN